MIFTLGDQIALHRDLRVELWPEGDAVLLGTVGLSGAGTTFEELPGQTDWLWFYANRLIPTLRNIKNPTPLQSTIIRAILD